MMACSYMREPAVEAVTAIHGLHSLPCFTVRDKTVQASSACCWRAGA